MIIIKTTKELRNYTKNLNKTIGFVPTMGALHEGHVSLIKQARAENEILIVSIFVNPTQFLQGEDFDKYPNKQKADKKICELINTDVLFMPNINDMYEDDEIGITAPKIRGFILEGLTRPEHFDGVLQIVLKLFNLVKPTNAYFGKKDAQQLFLIKQMTKNLFLDINIIECEIIRDENGLALSSRNAYLSDIQIQQALKISQSLKEATKLISSGELCKKVIIQHMTYILSNFNIEYIKIVSRDFKYIKKCEPKNTIILVAIKIGSTRLIDNIWL